MNIKEWHLLQNPYSDGKVIDACSVFGMMDTTGRRFSGERIVTAMANMHERSNGLGGGFAIYGLYPEYAEHYAFHVMFQSGEGKEATEAFLREHFRIVQAEKIPTNPRRKMHDPPQLWRYFLEVDKRSLNGQPEDDYVVEKVMQINTTITASLVFSSGKNMGVFKGVGYPEEIADYFCLDQYEGYIWTAHGRFPTNTPGWWGGAHPFSILDWTVVHNGEISSYGTNRRYLEEFGYQCTMQTDTEVVAYAIDLLVRRHGLPVDIAAKIFAPPLWSEIARLPEPSRGLLTTLRQVYGSLLLNGPFAVIIARSGEMIGLTDRIRLRPLTVGLKGSMLFLSSEEAAIRLVCPDVDVTWLPMGGEPIIGRLGGVLPEPPGAAFQETGVRVR
ncbi:MAG: glutamine amidotransferase family protein [Dehalococcoidales bacterium]|nr:glutamine amidotransferase family protein [Dehalococcoidales bacterium]